MKLLLSLTLWLLASLAWSQTALIDQLKAQLPAQAEPKVIFASDTGSAFQASGDHGVSSSIVAAGSGVPFSSSRRIVVPKALTPVWSALGLSTVLKDNIPQGHLLLASFWVRAPEMTGGRSGVLNAYFEKAGGDYASFATASASPDAVWRQIFMAGNLPTNTPREGLHISIHLGQQDQIIELAGLVILDLGQNIKLSELPHNQLKWPGMEADAPWRAIAQDRIEKLRRGNLVIKVIDAKGKAIPDATIHIEQIQRQFSFGSFTGHGETLLEKSSQGQIYRDFYKRLFDRATVPVYWADWGWVNHRARYTEIANWAKDQGLAIRAHVLIYPGREFMPGATKSLSAEDLQIAFLNQIKTVGLAYQNIPLREIDVTNELRDLTEIPNLVGRQGVTAWYKQARLSFPTVKLALNENTILTNGDNTSANQDIYLEWYRYLKSQGVAPAVLGLQSHFGESLTGPETLWKILDRFAAETDAELQITEFDINTGNEAAKAAYTRDFLTAIFAHPRVTAFTMWGFWEGDHWIPQAASWNKDWTARPAGLVLEELLGKTWRTHENWKSDSKGSASGRVWLGSLEITVSKGKTTIKQQISLDDPSKPGEMTIQLQ